MSIELNTQTYAQLVSAQVAAIQASSSELLDFEQGSILLSTTESNASAVGLWMQGLILILLATTRAATSVGPALDTWMADFNFFRLPATQSTGDVTFARFTPTFQAVVLANANPSLSTQVETADGTQIFAVIIDTTNANYNAGLGGYVLDASVSSISVPVQAIIPGANGNVGIGAINTLVTAIPYVDTVTNAAAFTNGANSESDLDFIARFILYINTLSRATKAAIAYAIISVQQGIDYNLTENLNYSNATDIGYFYAVVDDGSHSPSSGFLMAVGNAIEAYRGFCVTYGVFADTTITANVSMIITTAAGYTHSAVVAIVTAALASYIGTLKLGVTLPYTRLEEVAYDASPGVINVTNVLLNSGTSDLTATNQQVIIAGTITVT
jgi:hypothetical protein